MALRILLDIRVHSKANDSPAEDSAIPWLCLRAAGLEENHVRELLAARYLEHYLENTDEGSRGRTFLPAQSDVLTPRSCLLLTVQGTAYAEELLAGPAHVPAEGRRRPVWDSNGGELWWEECLIKRFRHDAANQRCVLDAFEASAWNRRISNPFRGKKGIRNSKRCLHRTIESLNEGQTAPPRIRFRGDGRGDVCWEAIACGWTEYHRKLTGKYSLANRRG
jgi:hypothetical protein